MIKFAILLVVGVIVRQAYGDEPEAIVGGNIALPGQFKHQISLQMNGNHLCGGSIISSFHILTAAHCIIPNVQLKDWTVVTGATSPPGGGQKHKIKCIQVHPGWGKSQFILDDIAVITLDKPIEFNGLQAPIRLASKDYRGSGQRAIVSGWGKTSVNSGPSHFLQWLEMNILSYSECASVHGPAVTEKQICTYQDVNKGACNGDSGGPLIVGDELVGVVSWGIPCARGQPDVFTNVFAYRDFIKKCQETC